MAEVKLKQHTHSADPLQIKEEPEPRLIKEEPEEIPFHIITVKIEDDEDKSSVLHQRPPEKNREEINGSSSDTDHSEDYSQEQVEPKRSYAMIPPESCVTDHTPFSCSDHCPFSCSDCGKSFRWRSALQRHMSVHTGGGPHKCPVCEKGFTLKSGLTRHLRVKHQTCVLCETHFTDENNLKEHLKTHVEEGTLHPSIVEGENKPFSCPECEKRFKYRAEFERHLLVHTGERRFRCSVCGKSFKEKGCLKTHMRTHTGEKAFVCSFCTKRFTAASSLKAHVRTHTGEKPCMCSVCGKCFSRLSSLKRHVRTHIEEAVQ